MSIEEKKEFLKSRGWETYYNPDYWIHEKTIVDKSRQDYTNYGMNLDDAYKFEMNNEEPFDGGFMYMRFKKGEIYVAPTLA